MVASLASCCGPLTAAETSYQDLVAEASFDKASVVDGGVQFGFDLGTKRKSWTNSRWSVMELAGPIDLSAFDHVKLSVSTTTPKETGTVTVAFREADGSWYKSR